jgi:hypothetical protein
MFKKLFLMRSAYGVDMDLSISGEGVTDKWVVGRYLYNINAILIICMGGDIKKIEKKSYGGGEWKWVLRRCIFQ